MAKRNKFLEGLGPDLFPLVLAGATTTYADAVNMSIDIYKGLLNMQSQVQPQATQDFCPVPPGMYPFQPRQVSQHSSHQRFKPRGKPFKKKLSSNSSGFESSSRGGLRAVFCGQCGDKNPKTRCIRFQGVFHIFGQYGHFASMCPYARS
ncbi:receptor-like serine/threonine-protein kinase [Dorcoceras hygrometricum]|uniref:Receptor-like serine/threonine-protein kinase n=1 Tax=Dorcoceras hygrometricum TaxID=472368 RepID=A0A2Z7AU44_9LAMI|nr:receptor-like serine/threonine-protein kinase [Dorcoceras hygrometricum]